MVRERNVITSTACNEDNTVYRIMYSKVPTYMYMQFLKTLSDILMSSMIFKKDAKSSVSEAERSKRK